MLCDLSPQLTVQCHQKKTAPVPRSMSRGSATAYNQFAYFTPDNSDSVYGYEWSTDRWEDLPKSPCCNSGLVVIDGALTTVGGQDASDFTCTAKLFTLVMGRWVEYYPPMNTGRFSPAALSTADGNYIFVIGGRVQRLRTTGDATVEVYHMNSKRWYELTNLPTVELFHVKSKRWYELTNLPKAFTSPSATICGNQLYVIGRDGGGYSCSLQALASAQQSMSQLTSNILTWKALPPLPVIWSTIATLGGQLVIVGGQKSFLQVDSIYQLIDGEWVKIGSMSSGREGCLLVTTSPDKMVIVSGLGGGDTVEECVVV